MTPGMVQHEMGIIMVGHRLPYAVYLMSSHVTRSTSPPPIFAYYKWSNMEVGTAWEEGQLLP